MAFHYPVLTAETYQQIVQEAAPGIRGPDFRRAERVRRPETRLLHVGAVTEHGLLIGFANVLGGPNDGDWLRPGHFKLHSFVAEGWRQRGAGSALYQEAARFAIEHGATALDAGVEESDNAGMAFAQHRGFVIEQHIFASTLNLTVFDSARFQATASAAEAAGIRFTSYAEYVQDDLSLLHFRDLLCDLHQDVPGEGDFQPTLEQLRTWYVQAANWDPAGILLAVDNRNADRWVALAHLTHQGANQYYNTFTGVHREYRGRGLAQAMKLKAVEYVRGKGGASIRTHNDSTNAPMLAVNRKLGYQPEPGYFKMVRLIV